MITEKTIKEECTNKNYFNDNYSYIAPASLFTYILRAVDVSLTTRPNPCAVVVVANVSDNFSNSSSSLSATYVAKCRNSRRSKVPSPLKSISVNFLAAFVKLHFASDKPNAARNS